MRWTHRGARALLVANFVLRDARVSAKFPGVALFGRLREVAHLVLGYAGIAT